MNRSYSKIRHIQESNLKLEKRLLNEQDDDNEMEKKVGYEVIIGMLMKSAESTPQENYDDVYDWMQDVFSPVENELEDMGVDIDDLRMNYDEDVMDLWERDDDDDDFFN